MEPVEKKMRVDAKALTASCPGKVLAAGGYAVLERPNPGLVLSTTARFHTEVVWESDPDATGTASELAVRVVSPQYRQELSLSVSRGQDDGLVGLNIKPDSSVRNNYVEQAVAFGAAAAIHAEARLRYGADLNELLSAPLEQLEVLTFHEIMSTLALHFTYLSSSFSVGTVRNEESANQNSLKVLAFASKFKLSDQRTLRLWGEHYRGVLADPKGTSHGNLRAFMAGGMACVKIGKTLDKVLVGMSPGATKLLSLGSAQTKDANARPLIENVIENDEASVLNELTSIHKAQRLCVTLRADNDFYSQQSHLSSENLPYNTASLEKLPPFLPCINAAGETSVSKTGLGSSAAMVTSVIAALIASLSPLSKDLLEQSIRNGRGSGLALLHAVSQVAHGVMQGKIGSGFDVCAAAFGSMEYVRYDSGCWTLKQSMETTQVGEARVVPPKGRLLMACIAGLNYTVKDFQLPPRLELMCGDVCGGSETPSMSRKILAWKSKAAIGPDDKSKHEFKKWCDLIEANAAVALCFQALHEQSQKDPTEYNSVLDTVALADSWDSQELAKLSSETMVQLLKLRTSFRCIRSLFRGIGDLADVPVEPECQTVLCDNTMGFPGAVLCGVPGAGGYDAVFAIVIDKKRQALEQFWAQGGAGKESSVCALLLSESRTHPGLTLKY